MTTIASAATTLRYLVEAHGDDYAAMAKNVADVSLANDVKDHFNISFEDAIEAVAEVLNHHIGEEELSILNPARTDAPQELRERLGKAWSQQRNALLEDDCGSVEQVERIVKRAYADGLLPNDDQPE